MQRFLTILFTATAACALCADSEKPSKAPAAEPASAVKNVSPDEAVALINGKPGVLVLDIRTPDEFANGRIPGAKNVDFFDDDFAKQVAALDSNKPVLVYCAVGGRSGQAMGTLAAMKKFSAIYHLKVGFRGWKAAKKPVEN